MLAKSPAFTAVAVLSLALGIGVNTAVFSVVDAMLFRPFPYDDPDRLVVIRRVDLQRPDRMPSLRLAEYLSWKQHADVFGDLGFHIDRRNFDVASEGHPTRRLQGASVSANLFATLGIEPLRGRGFLPNDEELGAADVIVLSHGLWQRRFGAEATVIGETLWLDRTAATIVGIMPLGFRDPMSPDAQLWAPAHVTPAGFLLTLAF